MSANLTFELAPNPLAILLTGANRQLFAAVVSGPLLMYKSAAPVAGSTIYYIVRMLIPCIFRYAVLTR